MSNLASGAQGITKAETGFTATQWRGLLVGFVLMLLSGLVNGWSIFVEPIENDLNLLRQDTALVFTISLSVSIGGQMLAGFLNKHLQSRVVYWIVAVLSLVGFFGTGAAQGIWEIYFFYGVFSGLAIGMIYNLVLTGVSALFHHSQSLVSGILLMGFGVGPLILGVGAAFLIESIGWRVTFYVLAVFYAVLLCGASWLIPTRKSGDAVASGKATGVSTLNMVKSRPYKFFFLFCLALGACALILIGHSSLICRDIGASLATASLLTGVCSVASGVSRVFFGRLADTKGPDALQAVLTFCAVAGSAAVLGGYALGLLPLLSLGYAVVGAANGGGAVYICAFIQQRYGTAHYGMNMAVTNVYMILGSVFGTAMAGTIKTQTTSYFWACVAMLVYAVFSVAMSVLLRRACANQQAMQGVLQQTEGEQSV